MIVVWSCLVIPRLRRMRQSPSIFFEDWAQAELERRRQRLQAARRRVATTKQDYEKARWEGMTEEERWWEGQRLTGGIFDN